MIHRLIARAVSFGLAVVVTLGMLGGIDQLAQPTRVRRSGRRVPPRAPDPP